jgi:hypothetical protein
MSLTKVTYAMIEGAQFNVLDYGAVGDGVANDTAAIQAAIDAANAIGGGTVWLPAGTYICENVNIKDKVTLVGTFGAVTMKSRSGVDCEVLKNAEENVPVVKNYFGVEGIIFDGNKANLPRAVARSAVNLSGLLYFYAKDCIFENASGYGLAFQGYPGGPVNNTQTKLYLENCHFINNGDGTLPTPTNTFDGLDAKECSKVTLVHCTASNNKDHGINIRGVSVAIIGGASFDNVNSGYLFSTLVSNTTGNTGVSVFGADAYANGGAGFAMFATTTVDLLNARVALTGVTSRGNLYGVQIPSSGPRVELALSDSNIFSNTSDGVQINNATATATISNCIIEGNAGNGVLNNSNAPILISGGYIQANGEYGYAEDANCQAILSGALAIKNNTLGQILVDDGSTTTIGSGVVTYTVGTGNVIASAATITIPATGVLFRITGSTTISDINSSVKNLGRLIILTFDGAVTVTDGGLKMAGNFVSNMESTLTFVYNGVRWCEVSRSLNS